MSWLFPPKYRIDIRISPRSAPRTCEVITIIFQTVTLYVYYFSSSYYGLKTRVYTIQFSVLGCQSGFWLCVEFWQNSGLELRRRDMKHFWRENNWKMDGRIMAGKNLDAETQLRDITVRKRSCEGNVMLYVTRNNWALWRRQRVICGSGCLAETRWFRTISGMFNVELSFFSFFSFSPLVFEGSGDWAIWKPKILLSKKTP